MMPNTNSQPTAVEGDSSILNSLADLFFRGLNHLLDSASEYQEEMGILKQVTTVNFKGTDGKVHRLAIKLAPVRDKKGLFYIEAFSDMEGFDVSSVNDSVIRLSTSNKRSLENTILGLLQSNGCTWTDEQGNPKDIADLDSEGEDSTTEDTQPEDNEEDDAEKELSNESKYEIQTNVDSIQKEIDEKGVMAISAKEGIVTLGVILSLDDSMLNCDIEIEEVRDMQSADPIPGYQPDTVSIPTINDEGDALDYDTIRKKVKKSIEDYLDSNKLEPDTKHGLFANRRVTGTFIKASEDVELTAISANFNIVEAADLIDDLASDENFLSMLSEEPISLSIEEVGDDYDIEEVETVDTESCYYEIFDLAFDLNFLCRIYQLYNSEDATVEDLEIFSQDIISHLVNWIYSLNGKRVFPSTERAFGILEEVRENDDLNLESLLESISDGFADLMDMLDAYYVNFKEDEQLVIDGWLNE